MHDRSCLKLCNASTFFAVVPFPLEISPNESQYDVDLISNDVEHINNLKSTQTCSTRTYVEIVFWRARVCLQEGPRQLLKHAQLLPSKEVSIKTHSLLLLLEMRGLNNSSHADDDLLLSESVNTCREK